MPHNVVQNPEEERLWEKAKGIAEESGKGENWAYVMGIFKKMNPERFKEAAAHIPYHEVLQQKVWDLTREEATIHEKYNDELIPVIMKLQNHMKLYKDLYTAEELRSLDEALNVLKANYIPMGAIQIVKKGSLEERYFRKS